MSIVGEQRGVIYVERNLVFGVLVQFCFLGVE